MEFEFDHLFVWSSPGAPEGDRLLAGGLTEGAPNTHPGQGTACRRFFFRNAYLELLWVQHPAEAQAPMIRPTHLWERWSGGGAGACPFGLIFRPTRAHKSDPPFSTWEYCPPYLPESVSIRVGSNASVLTEPMLFYLPFAQRPDAYALPRRQPQDHAVGVGEVTRVSLAGPWAGGMSPELEAVRRTGLIELRAGPEHLAEMGFDGERGGKRLDLRPALPLILRW